MRNPKYYILILSLFIHFELIKAADRIVFSFPEFQYKESSRNVLRCAIKVSGRNSKLIEFFFFNFRN